MTRLTRRLFGLGSVFVAGLLCYLLYRIVLLVGIGFSERDLWFLVGGGILLYCFLGILIVGIAILAILGYLGLSDIFD